MFRQKQSPFAAYLRHVMGHLRKLPPEQQDAIRRELHAHMEDAAAEQGQTAADPVTQTAIISRLGPGQYLGSELADAHGLYLVGWNFWKLWIFVVMVGPLIIFSMFMFCLSLSRAIVVSLHRVTFEHYIDRLNWGRWETSTYIGGWFLGITLLLTFWVSPYTVKLPEDQAEAILLMTFFGVVVIVGVMQWLTIRRHIAYAVVWVITPLLGLITSLFGSMAIYWWIEGMTVWGIASFVGAIVYGACYGAVTGGVMVGLLRLTGLTRQDGVPPQTTSIAR